MGNFRVKAAMPYYWILNKNMHDDERMDSSQIDLIYCTKLGMWVMIRVYIYCQGEGIMNIKSRAYF